MAYHALYRSYRPQLFKEVVGQEHITKTLQNALRQGRVGHAYLFSGPRGTGKTSVARLFAKAVNCTRRSPESGEPCNECDVCKEINAGTALDVIEIDAASHRGIDEIRDLRDKVRYVSGKCPYKVYIIDEVHMLTDPAFNALLKTLEDPPGQVLFILATTDPQKVPVTILSRCQRFDFRRLTNAQIRQQLRFVCEREQIMADDEALQLIAQHAGGSMRDALSILDQARSVGEQESIDIDKLLLLLGTADEQWLFEITEAAVAGDLAAGFQLVADAFAQGRDPRQLLKDWVGHLRNLLVVRVGVTDGDVLSCLPEQVDRLRQQASTLDPHRILSLLEYLSERESVMRWVPDGRIALETAFMRAVTELAGAEGRSHGTPATPPLDEEPAQPEPGTVGTRDLQAVPASRKTAPKTASGEKPRLQLIIDAWKKITDNVRRRNPRVYALIEPAELHELDGHRLVLGFRGYEFHRNQMQLANNQRVLAEAIYAVLGIKVKIECMALPANNGKSTEDSRGKEEAAGSIKGANDADDAYDANNRQDSSPVDTYLDTGVKEPPEPLATGDVSSLTLPDHNELSGLVRDAMELLGGRFVTLKEGFD